jgi:hypothetical protein
MFTRKFDRRVRTLLGVLGFSTVLGVGFGTFALWQANMEKGYEPDQPVYFPHSIMAGKHKIPCEYCHTEARKGPHAGIPPVSLCMNCHAEVQTKDAQGNVKASIAKLLEYWEAKKPIPWVKVHDLADFAYFDHSRHLTEKAGLECADCHGAVEEMNRMTRVNSLKMGWCLECHMQEPPEDAPEWQKTRAPINCSACHR